MTSGAERFQRMIGISDRPSDLKHRTVRGGAFAMASEASEFVLRLVSIAILARLLVPESFGIIAMVTAITAIAERFKDLGLGSATVQRKEITYEQVSTLFWINAGIGVGLVLLVACLAQPIARFYGDPRLFLVTLAIASSFFWGGLTVQHQALLRRQMKFGQIAAIQICSSVLSIAVAVALAMADYGYWALVWREITRPAFLAVGTWLCCRWVPGPPSRGAGVRSMLGFGGNLSGFNLVWFLSSSLDQILIGKLFGATSLGFYRQGIQLVLAPVNQLTFPVHAVGESALSRLQTNPERYRTFYLRILTAVSLATMPLFMFLAVFAQEVVLVALGSQWIEATPFFRILAIAAFLKPAASTFGLVMITTGRSRRYLISGTVFSLGLVVLIVLGTRWGPLGVAWAHVASTYLMLVPMLYWSFKDTPLKPADFALAVYRPILASLAMAALLEGTKTFLPDGSAFVTLTIGMLVAGPAYLSIWLLIPAWRSELKRTVAASLSIVSGKASGARPPQS